MDAQKKMSKRDSYTELVSKLFDILRVSVDEEKDGYVTIKSAEAKKFKKELAAITERESLFASKDTLLRWAFLAHDFNRSHIFGDYARDSGFETTPMHGTLIAAGYEYYINKLNELINKTTGRSLVYSGQAIKFKQPSYVKRYRRGRVNWGLENISSAEDGFDLNVSGINSEKEKAISFYSTRLRNELKKPDSDFVTPFTVPSNILERSNIEIKEGERESSYYFLGKKPGEGILMSHPAAFITATMLRLASRRTGSPEGKFSKMDLNFHNKPELGIFETMIRLSEPPKKLRDSFRYVFDAYCVQGDKPIVSGQVTGYSDTEIKLD